jgi:hypothetical protein
MSEGIVVALISVAGAVIGAAITAFGSMAAAERKNDSSKMGCGLLGFIASAGALGGLVLGAVFAVLLTQFTGSTTSTIEPRTHIQSSNPVALPNVRTTSDKRSALEDYGVIYQQSGWCALWDHLVKEGGASGQCPSPRYGQGNTDPNIEIIDGFVAKEGGYIAAFALQADSEVQINYSRYQCVSFDPTNLSINYNLASDRVTQIQPNGWVASDVSISGPFSLWLRCDGNWR